MRLLHNVKTEIMSTQLARTVDIGLSIDWRVVSDLLGNWWESWVRARVIYAAATRWNQIIRLNKFRRIIVNITYNRSNRNPHDRYGNGRVFACARLDSNNAFLNKKLVNSNLAVQELGH